MKNIICCAFCLFLCLCACKKESVYPPLAIVQYTDSTFTKKIDSVTADSLPDSLNGYFIIHDLSGPESFRKGRFKNGIKTGKWLQYEYMGRVLTGIENYNAEGVLDGEYFSYFSDGKPLSHFNYYNNQQLGEQKEYYSDGGLAVRYYRNSANNYTKEYLALKQDGDTLYYTAIPKKGIAYLREYDNWGILMREGLLINQQYAGLVKEYEYDPVTEKYIYAHLYNYVSPDSTLFIKKVKLK